MRTTFTTTDEAKAMRLLKADDMAHMIEDFKQWLRKERKHRAFGDMKAEEYIDEVWDMFHAHLNDSDLQEIWR